ncbi:MAG: hypothetical protein GY797_32085 [Deltaproteobacteria bacterium]|nr:hypothetical protein [Deltaproteobacteria bacterium]
MKFLHALFLSMILVILFSGCTASINEAVLKGNLNDVISIVNSDRSKIHTIEDGETLLHIAADSGYTDIVKYLVSQGADVNSKAESGDTPLHNAVGIGNGKIEIAKYLVSNGAEVNTQNTFFFQTPLHRACYVRNIETVKYLVSQGANVTIKDKSGETPLHIAAKSGHIKTVEYLVSQGADINEINNNGETPLYLATRSAEIGIVKYLISQDADAIIKSNSGETAYNIAQREGHYNIAAFLSTKMQRTKKVKTAETSKKKLQQNKKPLSTATTHGTASDLSRIDFGRYFSLVIGNNNYQSLPKLKTAKNDAQVVAGTLKKSYGFNVELLIDATRSDILLALNKLRRKLTKRDNLLIYYAGHGWLDNEADEGYWLPTDAQEDNTVNWVSNSYITSTLRAIEAKHVLIVADSCYSGKLGRGLHIRNISPSYLDRISKKKARSVISSGGLEPVIDSGGEGRHSVFASVFLKVLRENTGVMDGTQLFLKIRRPVMLNADQTPEYSDIRKAGHQGGDFLFVRNK